MHETCTICHIDIEKTPRNSVIENSAWQFRPLWRQVLGFQRLALAVYFCSLSPSRHCSTHRQSVRRVSRVTLGVDHKLTARSLQLYHPISPLCPCRCHTTIRRSFCRNFVVFRGRDGQSSSSSPTFASSLTISKVRYSSAQIAASNPEKCAFKIIVFHVKQGRDRD